MAGNSQPQFTAAGDIQSVLFGGTALTTSDGSSGTIGTTMQIAYTSSSTNGSYVEALRIFPVSSVAAASTAATVARVYVSTVTSGSTSTTNTWLIAEIALASVTADQSTTAINWYDVPLGFRLNPSYTILVSSHVVNATNTNLRATVFGADY